MVSSSWTGSEGSQESIGVPVSVNGTSERCRVLVRLRPLPTNEKATPYRVLENPERVVIDTVATNRTPVKKGKEGTNEDPNTFTFDKIFPRESTQQEVFETVVGDSVDSVLAGFNATVLAYGQTGAGKTYNMFGDDEEEARGMVPRALDALFSQVDKDESGSAYVIKLSMMEIYLEELRDLLRPVACSRLKLRESSFDGVWVEGLHHVCVPSSAAALELVLRGMGNRTTGATNMNDVSSRSHCIVSLRVEKTMPDGVVQTGVLHFADLAGMERVDRTGAHGQSLEEAKRINLSLSALGNCIAALSQPNRHHIPFRDAKLTFLLKNSLGGNAKTTLLIAVSPRFRDLDESLGAFRFGQRARSVKNVVSVNRKLSPQELQRLLDKLQQEHRTLQDYCISLEEKISELTGSKKSCAVDASTSVGDANMSLNANLSLNQSVLYQTGMGTAAAMRGSLLAPVSIPPNLPISPAIKWNSMGMSPTSKRNSIGIMSPCSPVHDMDPLMLLHKISVLEAEKRDMMLEIEAISHQTQQRNPNMVAGTSLSREDSRNLAEESSDTETTAETVHAPHVCGPLEAVSTMCQGNQTVQDQACGLDQSNQMGADDSAQDGLNKTSAWTHDASCHAQHQMKNALCHADTGIDDSLCAVPHQAFDWHEAATQMSPVHRTSMETQSKQPLRGTLRKRGRSMLGLQKAVSCEITMSSLFYETALVGVRKEIQLERVQSVSALKRSGFSIVTGQAGDLKSNQANGGVRTFVFRAESDKQRDQWLSAIKERVSVAAWGKSRASRTSTRKNA